MSISTPATIAECRRLLDAREISVRELTRSLLDRINILDPKLNCFTAITAERALAEAETADTMRGKGEATHPLSGIPYVVKNLYDVANITTLAGAKLNAGRPPASRDASIVRRLSAAGAVLLGTTNMDAYAYGFTTENTHFGVTRNPHDPTRTAGGSSGGSASALAAGMAMFALGSDTNGSIRVPAAFCGLFGLKPTFGRLSRAGTWPFVPSLDHVGPFTRSAEDLALVYDALQGTDPTDPACAQRAPDPALPSIERGIDGLRIAVLDGFFHDWADADARDAVQRAAYLLGAVDHAELREAGRARAAAFIITASEGGSAYLNDLRSRPQDFEPLSRERLVAGALLPAAWYLKAQRFRSWFRQQASQLFEHYDLLLAPAVPFVANPFSSQTVRLNGIELPLRPNIGLMTQPISFIGLPTTVAPMKALSGLPIGVQLIAAPWREDVALRAAWALEQAGVTYSPIVTP